MPAQPFIEIVIGSMAFAGCGLLLLIIKDYRRTLRRNMKSSKVTSGFGHQVMGT